MVLPSFKGNVTGSALNVVFIENIFIEYLPGAKHCEKDVLVNKLFQDNDSELGLNWQIPFE